MPKNETSKATCDSGNLHADDESGKSAGVPSRILLFIARFGIWMPVAAVAIKSLEVESLLGHRLSEKQAFIYLMVRLAIFASVAIMLGVFAIWCMAVLHHSVPSHPSSVGFAKSISWRKLAGI